MDKKLIGKRIIICFEGVEQAMYLWLNGQFVGYAEDSFTPSEFDLTPYIREKGNVLAVEVHKMSTVAFLEDQDFFRFFGIFRNVTMKALPDAHIEDIWINPILNQDNVGGKISVEIKVSSLSKQNLTAHFFLKDRDDCMVCEETFSLQKEVENYLGHVNLELLQVNAWDNHQPYLYSAFVELIDDIEAMNT